MKLFKVVTVCTAVTEYFVKAENFDDAEERYESGEYFDDRVTDYKDEEIIKVEEQK